MKLTFLGAAKTVTGSCFLLETKTKKILVDCGMFQGHSREHVLNSENFAFSPGDIDYVLLTHAHIDHSGRIPKLYIEGFKGEIIATKATVELCSVMLPDSGHIQEVEVEWLNKKRARANKHLVQPLYTMQDAVNCMKLFRSVNYNENIKLDEYISVRFRDAGHMLGSSIIEVWVKDGKQETKLVFTGDLGNEDIPLLRDPGIIEDADYLIMESTYGNRLHIDNDNKVEKFVDIITETINNGGNVIIPSFAVGRTQEVIYELHKEKEKYGDKIERIRDIPVYVDSPLAVSATEIFRKNLDCFDEETRRYIESGDNPLDFPGLRFTRSADESKMLNELTENVVIISASGMCEAGRIKHHLKHNLWRPENTVLFVGYQAQGTLGRKILDGTKRVKIFGEEISVNARIESIDGFSGHADKDGLLDWVGNFKKKPRNIFIVHGEPEAQEVLAKEIEHRYGIECIVPERGASFAVSGTVVTKTEVIPYEDQPRFIRLSILEQLGTLREELDELTEILKMDLKEDKDDQEIIKLRAKLKNLEKAMVEVLR